MIWPPPDQTLNGEIVRLEPIAERHRTPLFEVSGDAEAWLWTDRRVPRGRTQFDAWFDDRLAALDRVIEWGYVTHSQDSGLPIGSSSYLNIRREHDSLEIGWTWLEPGSWRSGANLEAKLLMLGQAFDHLGCMRVELKTDARNRRSREAISGLGATEEGTFRKHMFMPELGVRDTVYFSILDSEWLGVRDGLRRRLREGSKRTGATGYRGDAGFDGGAVKG